MDILKFSALSVTRLKINSVAGLVDQSLLIVTPAVSLLGDTGKKVVDKLTIDVAIMKREMGKPRSSMLTKPIADENLACDNLFAEIKRSSKVGEKSSNPFKAEAGKTLMHFLDGIWDTNKKEIPAQISAFREMYEKYTASTSLQEAAIVLDISSLFLELSGHNTTLGMLYQQRNAETTDDTKTASELRANVESGYDNLCTLVVQTVNVTPVSEVVLKAFNEMEKIRKVMAALLPSRHDIKEATVNDIPPYPYTGQPITPIPEVYFEGKPLVFSVDFTPSYRKNIDPGEARIILHGKGRFRGIHNRSFTITGLKGKNDSVNNNQLPPIPTEDFEDDSTLDSE
jgi:hypothetical protein